MALTYGDLEPVVPDGRVWQAQERVVKVVPSLRDSTFVTFIVPEHEDGERIVPDLAVFAILSPNPRKYGGKPGPDIMTQATTRLSDWLEAEKERQHFANKPDLLVSFFGKVAVEHNKTMQNLRALI